MNFKMKGNGSINIDGRSFSGRSVVIKNGKVTVDGVLQDGDLTGPVSITVQGDVETIDGEFADVTVTGSCGSVKTMSGDVECADVAGSVSTMSGDVTAAKIGGSVSSMSGDIRTK